MQAKSVSVRGRVLFGLPLVPPTRIRFELHGRCIFSRVEIRKLQGKPTKQYETKRIHMQADFLRFPMRYDKLLLESRWQQSLHHVRLVLAKQASFPTRPAIHCEAGKFPHEAG